MQNRPEVAFSSAGGLKILSEIYKIKKRGLHQLPIWKSCDLSDGQVDPINMTSDPITVNLIRAAGVTRHIHASLALQNNLYLVPVILSILLTRT
jgi:hypothetical protein